MARQRAKPTKPVEDLLAERESTAIANGDYEAATQVGNFKSSRRFRQAADNALIGVFWFIVILWILGASLSALTVAAPEGWTDFLDSEQKHMLWNTVCSSAITTFGTKFFAKRIGV